MKLFQTIKANKRKVLPPAIVVSVLVLAGTVSYVFSPNGPLVTKQSENTGKIVSYNEKPTQPIIPTTAATVTADTAVLGSKTRSVTPQPTITKSVPTNASTTVTNNTGGTTSNAVQTASAPTNTPAIQQTNPTATTVPAAQTQTVSVEIKSPDGSTSFTVVYSSGMNACDSLQKAKDAGKINSVTLSDAYMSTLQSLYVAEINGHANNWTFTVNGASPLGCSLSQPKPNDSIVWKFG